MEVNYYVLLFFGPVLIIVGALGFVVPSTKSLTSTATAYNIFHIVFGIIGLLIALSGAGWLIVAFNVGFGLIDLYQAAASHLGWFPKEQFRWKRADDVLHVVVGTVLMVVGVVGSL